MENTLITNYYKMKEIQEFNSNIENLELTIGKKYWIMFPGKRVKMCILRKIINYPNEEPYVLVDFYSTAKSAPTVRRLDGFEGKDIQAQTNY